MKVRAFMLMLLLSLSFSGVWAAEADIQKALPSLSEAEYQELLGGVIVDGSTIGGGSILPYVVSGTEAAKRAAQAQNAEGGFSIAAVSYIPYGPKLKAMDMKTRQLAIFNKIRAISTQEGLTYISWRAGNKPKVLIEKSSYMEDDKNLNNLLPDPIATTFPYSLQNYVYQRDSSFGGNRYLHTYTNTDEEIFVEIKNISSMRVLGIFTAVKKEQLTISMATYQMEDGLLLMALTTIKDRDPKVSVLGITVDLPSAFKRRITALQNWFVDQLATIEN
ncbi:DUF6675 family protein [Sphaerochaeta sp.]|uniref:DUF6675 family protein n=1 Tax=Sphaerochaeta sp. TaxID=1972642 RepID=UPI003D0AF2DC